MADRCADGALDQGPTLEFVAGTPPQLRVQEGDKQWLVTFDPGSLLGTAVQIEPPATKDAEAKEPEEESEHVGHA